MSISKQQEEMIEKMSKGNATTKDFYRAIAAAPFDKVVLFAILRDKMIALGAKPDLLGKIWDISGNNLDKFLCFVREVPIDILLMISMMQGTRKERDVDEKIMDLFRYMKLDQNI